VASKKPCAICRRWFHPDPRVGARQRACSKACSTALRKKTQTKWRERNAGYAVASRIQERAGKEPREPRRMPSPLSRLPWDLAKDEFGIQGTDFLQVFGRVLVRVAKDEIRAQPADTPRELAGLPAADQKDEMRRVAG
jgi:hypothetical protein